MEMKICPTCQRTYPDDAPDFCTEDGMRLVAETASGELQATMLAPSAPPVSPIPPAPSQSPQFNQPPMGQMPGNFNAAPQPPLSSPAHSSMAEGKRKGLAIVSLLFGLLSVVVATAFLLLSVVEW
jgi:hypothetical protein